MKLVKSLVLVCALFVPAVPALPAEDIPGKIIFSVEEVDAKSDLLYADGRDRPVGRTGIFYYYKEAGPGKFDEASLIGYRFQGGEITGRDYGGGEPTEERVKKLKALPISTFDVARELNAAHQKMRTQASRTIWVQGGNKYRIHYDFNSVSIDYTGQTPGTFIDALAPFSENLTNLKQLMDFLALSYGRSVFGQ